MPCLGAEIQQPFALRVLANRAGEVVVRDAVDDLRPGLAVVVGPVDVRRAVVLLVPVRGDIGGAGADAATLRSG